MTAFARVTEIHDALSLSLTPCAGQLYRWLLRRCPAGKEQEVELEDFSMWSGAFRRRPYNIRHVQRALDELIEMGLVVVVKQYTRRIYKLICLHPSQSEQLRERLNFFKDENIRDHYLEVRQTSKKSKIEASNPYVSVPTYREYRETTDTVPTHHPVQVISEEGTLERTEPLRVDSGNMDPMLNTSQEEKPDKTPSIGSPPKFSGEIKIEPQLEQEIQEAIAPCAFNVQLKRIVVEAGAELVTNALKVLEQNKKKRKVKNPAGLFRKALVERWTPNNEDPTPPKTFNEWFNLARDAGIVMSSQFTDGKLWVFDTHAQPCLYEEMLQRYPLEFLRAAQSNNDPSRSPAARPGPRQPLPAPMDFSDLLAAIDIQIARLGWSKDKVEQFLKTTYGKISRSLLRDEELMDFKLQLQRL